MSKQQEYENRQKESGWKKVGALLAPEYVAIVERHKAEYGGVAGVLRASLELLDKRGNK